MRMLLWLVAFSVVVCSLRAADGPRETGGGQSLGERLGAQVEDFNTGESSAAEALVGLAYRYHLPTALEYVDRDSLRTPVKLRLHRVTARRAIELVVAAAPPLRVAFTDGLVDVYSPAARADPSNLLNAVLPKFEVDNADAALASTSLFDALTALKKPGTPVFSSVAGTGGPRVTIHARNMRVYEILNTIVRQQGDCLWVVAVAPEGLRDLNGALWRLYSLKPGFESTVTSRLITLFPPSHKSPHD